MKKIVALVLSLVMALSLCTVAFAADKYSITKVGKDGDGCVVDGSEVTKVKYVEQTDTKLAHYKGDNGAFYVVSEDEDVWGRDKYGFCYAMIKDDGTTVYLLRVLENELNVMKATEVAKHDYVGCGDNMDKAPADTYKDVKNSEYWIKDDDGTAKVTVDGKYDNIIKVRKATTASEQADVEYIKKAEVVPAKHLMVLVAKNVEFKTSTDGKVVPNVNEYKCAFCGRTFYGSDTPYSVPETADTYSKTYAQKLIQAGMVQLKDGVVLGDVKYYWASDESTGTKDDTKKDGIDSAKTFDAGVAMYVGMSLLSVAGSAVVIGKKKEF